jgi:DNA-binding NarL/FixJ family response regulator
VPSRERSWTAIPETVARSRRTTVETYRSRLTQKLGIHTLPELVRFRDQHGVKPL